MFSPPSTGCLDDDALCFGLDDDASCFGGEEIVNDKETITNSMTTIFFEESMIVL